MRRLPVNRTLGKSRRVDESVTETLLETSWADGGIAVITLSNPPANALANALIRELRVSVQQAAQHPDTRAILLTGAGTRFFCAGGDFKEMYSITREQGTNDRIREFHYLLQALENLSMPYVCAINGYAVGGGFELCLFADYAVSVPHARYGFPEINHGLLPAPKGMKRAVELLGLRAARRLLFEGTLIDAAEALRLGIVDDVVDQESLLDHALASARTLAGKDPGLLRAIKETLSWHESMTDPQLEELAVRHFESYFGSDEMFALLDALMNRKRTPLTGATAMPRADHDAREHD